MRRALTLYLALVAPALLALMQALSPAVADGDPAGAAQANPALTRRAALPMLAADSATGSSGVTYTGGLTPAGGTGSHHTAGTVLKLCYSLTPGAAFDFRLYKTAPGSSEVLVVADSDTAQGCTAAALPVNTTGRTDFRMQFLVGGQAVATATAYVIVDVSPCTGAPQPCTAPYTGSLIVNGRPAGGTYLANSGIEMCFALTPTDPFDFRLYRTYNGVETLITQGSDDGTGDCLDLVLLAGELGRKDYRVEFRAGTKLLAEASAFFFVVAP